MSVWTYECVCVRTYTVEGSPRPQAKFRFWIPCWTQVRILTVVMVCVHVLIAQGGPVVEFSLSLFQSFLFMNETRKIKICPWQLIWLVQKQQQTRYKAQDIEQKGPKVTFKICLLCFGPWLPCHWSEACTILKFRIALQERYFSHLCRTQNRFSIFHMLVGASLSTTVLWFCKFQYGYWYFEHSNLTYTSQDMPRSLFLITNKQWYCALCHCS
jgi:hypothetical protein